MPLAPVPTPSSSQSRMEEGGAHGTLWCGVAETAPGSRGALGLQQRLGVQPSVRNRSVLREWRRVAVAELRNLFCVGPDVRLPAGRGSTAICGGGSAKFLACTGGLVTVPS